MEVINKPKAGRGGGAPARMQAQAAAPQQSIVEQLQLERVYGSGSCSAGTVTAQHPVVPGLIAYTSGGVVTLYDSVHKQQQAFFAPKDLLSGASAAGKPFACLAFSRDGAYLAAGEHGNGSPAIWIWEVNSSRCMQVLRGHKCGVSSVAFSGQDGRLLVSTGAAYDGQLCVWDWKQRKLLVKQPVQGEVAGACVSEDETTVTTVGKSGHFKVWTLPAPSGKSSISSRSVNLKEFRTSSFVGVAAAPGAPHLTYALTSSGVLLSVSTKGGMRSLDKSVNLQVPAAFALAASSDLVACACAAGVVRLFEAGKLVFKGNLPRHSARSGGVGAAPEGQALVAAGALFPDALGVVFDSKGERLTVAYADRSVLVWDVRNPGKVVRARSVLSHAGVIWSAHLIPPWLTPLLGASPAAPTPGGGSDVGAAPGQTSVLCTCGADGTVRMWNICLNNSASTAGPGLPGAAAAKHVALRCLRVSPCGRHLATGDSRGNLRVFSTATLQQLLLREAHDAEVLSLDYSQPSMDGACYLASGSRDALVHVYDMSRGYELVGTCDAHGGPVTAVRFSSSGGRMALLSCSADKSVVFRRVQMDSIGLSFRLYHTERMSRGVLYDLAVDPGGGRAVAVGHDGQIRVFDVATGRALRNFAGDPSCGEAVSVLMDPTGSLAVCSCADGGVAVYDVDSGRLVARGSGHSEVCTGAALLEDHRGLVTVGGDGCALLWRLPAGLSRRMQEAAAQCRRQLEAQMAAQAQAEAARVQEATPAMPRRKAWGVCEDAVGGPQQVQVDLSATMLRLREDKPPPQPPQPVLGPHGVEPRAWAVVVEEDDEIVYCDPEEEEGGAAGAGPEPPVGTAEDFAVRQDGDADDAGLQDEAAAEAEGGGETEAEDAAGIVGGQSEAQGDGEDADALEEPVSGCASNRVGGTALGPGPDDTEGVRRDLFREHFDSLGLDQASTTKQRPQDPRRQSLSLLYRQARAAGSGSAAPATNAGAGAGAAPNAISPPRLTIAPPTAAAAGPSTPYLAKLPPPPGINVSRGAAVAAEQDVDGAVTSAMWTPERAMMPLTSPALANTAGTVEPPATGLFVYNPMFGATPGTPVLGLTVAQPPAGLADAPASAPVPVQQPQALAAAAPPPAVLPPAPACGSDGIIQAVLQPPAGSGDPAEATGVCLVRRDGGDGKAAQQQQADVVAVQDGTDGVGVAVATSPAKRRLRAELPVMRSKGSSPAKGPPEVRSGNPDASNGCSLSEGASTDGVLLRMQLAMRDFIGMYHKVHSSAITGGAASASEASNVPPSSTAVAAAQRYREAAVGAVAELTALLAAGSLPKQPGPDPSPPVLPPAEACSSPRVPSAAGTAGSDREVPAAAASARAFTGVGAVAASCSSVYSGGLGSSQVALEVGLVESLVEEKVRQQLRDVEQAISQRIMQSMFAQAQR
ncbi:hypothetical protein GPECTOR_3g517 [Gonium pectorale]|uniref:Anaphase-promoting complex subunit 4 WD40 domain-containing protein n=1 Tax=Gonium pectorale TaxID=33097 RepID=A0A150GZX5_GONPE|nr:hypothetical protein GPECTOR_3g517 [Gonium pectorale]|eukprot:KXZ55391.1 hypothetical protein GPECTOR_3g517 [Gonium pectorale]